MIGNSDQHIENWFMRLALIGSSEHDIENCRMIGNTSNTTFYSNLGMAK